MFCASFARVRSDLPPAAVPTPLYVACTRSEALDANEQTVKYVRGASQTVSMIRLKCVTVHHKINAPALDANNESFVGRKSCRVLASANMPSRLR